MASFQKALALTTTFSLQTLANNKQSQTPTQVGMGFRLKNPDGNVLDSPPRLAIMKATYSISFVDNVQ